MTALLYQPYIGLENLEFVASAQIFSLRFSSSHSRQQFNQNLYKSHFFGHLRTHFFKSLFLRCHILLSYIIVIFYYSINNLQDL